MARRPRPRGLGWLYPPQPCGLPYDKFRSGLVFKDAYEALAYRKHGPHEMTFSPSPRRVVSQLSTMKHEMFNQYQKDCADASDATGIDYRAEYARCRRVCSTKTNPCGNTCVTKKKACRKPPAEGICSVDRFQMSIPLETLETAAQAESRGGDTSFDPAEFAPAAPSRAEPAGGWFGARRRPRKRTARAA